jgi:hypothetical protein
MRRVLEFTLYLICAIGCAFLLYVLAVATMLLR